MNRSDLATVVGLGVIAGVTIVVMVLNSGCGARQDAKYAAEFERCLQTSQTCEEYLKCWQDNQRSNGQVVTGRCGGKDAGIDR